MKIKMKLLSPVHIGTGEDYDPTTFIIDGGYLYEFDETLFFRLLDPEQKKLFMQKVSDTSPWALFEVHAFIKRHKELAKKAAKFKVRITEGIEKEYHNKVGRAVQREGRQKQKVFNRFQIARTLRNPNTNHPYLPGSSIKGSIATAIGEYFFKQDPKRYREIFENRNPSMSPMKNLSVSDAKPLRLGEKIGYALNKERFEEDDEGPSNRIEVIVPGSEFECSLGERSLQPPLSIRIGHLAEICNEHYLPLFRQAFKPRTIFRGKEVDDYSNEYYPEDFYRTYKDFEPSSNQFLLRVGKHSGARAVTIDGMREIGVKVSGGGPRRKPNRWETLDQETTTWLFGGSENDSGNLLPFGWILCQLQP